MELNKNSLWLKFYLFFNNLRPTNFCDYFWGSLKSIIIAIIIITCLLLLIVCLLSPIFLFWENFDEKSNLGTFQIFGNIFWFSIIGGTIVYKTLDYHDSTSKNYKKPSIIKTWYKDFKNKHCTMITWK